MFDIAPIGTEKMKGRKAKDANLLIGEIIMDKEIQKVKKHIDKDMTNLLKKDKVRDAKCEHDEKMAKKKKK